MCVLVCVTWHLYLSNCLHRVQWRVIFILSRLTEKIEQFAGMNKKDCGILTLPWRWQSRVGSTCRQGNNWGQRFPEPPSWWPFPQRRKQRYSRPVPEGACWKTANIGTELIFHTIRQRQTGNGSHQYGDTFEEKLQKCQWRKKKVLSPLLSFIPVGNSSGLAWLWLCLN